MILLTGFNPFAGRGSNGSESLARHLSGRAVGGIRCAAEVLDVLWGGPERRLPELFAEFRPSLLLGLGEGSGDALRFETRAFNRASGLDEAGQTVPHLEPGGELVRCSTMQFDPAWLADMVPVESSEDAGEFLCNAWLYIALGLATCPTAFVHLPVQGGMPDSEYCALWSPAIIEILERNLSV